MRGPFLVLHQFRYEQKRFWRNPAAVGFTTLFPVMFLLILASIFGDDDIRLPGTTSVVSVSTYYVPALLSLAVVSATLINVTIRLTIDREYGILKRLRGTPLPPAVFIAGRVGNSLVISAVMAVTVTAIGALVYDVEVPWEQLPALVLVLVVAAMSFCCMGFALTAAIPNEDAAPPIANLAVFPLYFLSGVFIPESELSDGILDFAAIFPIRPLMLSLIEVFDPAASGFAVDWGSLAVVAAWGGGALLIALRWFDWAPKARN